MPDLMDRIYCSEQIHIPPTFPYIMKLYCKAAIRTQPYDLLKWSAAYFRALANGEEPPVKERVEYPPYDSPSGLTPGYIKILINQFGKNPSTTVTAQTLFRKWSDICLDEYLLVKLIALLGAKTVVNWVQFVGVCAGFISKTLTQTMVLICELFTEEPEGGMATIPYELFIDLYMFLAQMECGPLTEEEKANLDAILYEEEDICSVADKIKQGFYEGEGEGELTAGEEIEGESEEVLEEEQEVYKEKTFEDEEAFQKGMEEMKSNSEEEEKEEEALLQKEADETPKEEPKRDSAEEKNVPPTEKEEAEEPVGQEKVQEEEGEEEEEVVAAEVEEEEKEEEEEGEGEGEGEGGREGEVEEEEEEEEEVAAAKEPRIISLEDLEDSIRVKIEAKLAEEEDKEKSEMGEEEKEFENLSSYLLGAAARVQKYTAETLGFKIFKRFLRQEIPGIGPRVDSEQIEKVVNFMDSWAFKQELMVMPRNIRHWMCPPLDKVPTPQP